MYIWLHVYGHGQGIVSIHLHLHMSSQTITLNRKLANESNNNSKIFAMNCNNESFRIAANISQSNTLEFMSMYLVMQMHISDRYKSATALRKIWPLCFWFSCILLQLMAFFSLCV